ncbi:MAG: DUF3445 domain-containing protein, partial [Phycisphaeraceae bacterium]|nr:DUF3445 domain-containing protein [Phycisphaeraceae bacterium]
MGLRSVETDFGNGHRDRRILQRDRDHAAYRRAKQAVFELDPNLCTGRVDCPQDLLDAAGKLLSDAAVRASIRLNGERLEQWALELQEDLAIVRWDAGHDWVCWAHICLPSGWDPSKVIGKSFSDIHRVVPGMDRLVQSGLKIARF